MDDADAAELGHGDGHAAFGHGVHGGADERRVEGDVAGEPGGGGGVGREEVRIVHFEGDVIEGQGLVRERFHKFGNVGVDHSLLAFCRFGWEGGRASARIASLIYILNGGLRNCSPKKHNARAGRAIWCERRESNPHPLPDKNLNLMR